MPDAMPMKPLLALGSFAWPATPRSPPRPTFRVPRSKEGVTEAGGLKGEWDAGPAPNLAVPGTYVLSVSGSLMRDRGGPIAFETGALSVELGARDIKSLAEIEAVALRE